MRLLFLLRADTGDTAGDDIPVPEDNIANVLGACEGLFRTPDEYPNQLVAGDELHRYRLADPEAVCNDGTRAVMYLRAATDETLRGLWSSRWTPDTVGGVGVADTDPANALAGANQAWLYFCSTDLWAGQGTATFAPTTDAYASYPPYTMFVRGHTILTSALAELREGVVAGDGEAMSALSDASVVMLSGTSAGSVGVQFNADFVRDTLAADGTRVFAVVDAANDPPDELFSPEVQASLEATFRARWADVVARSDVAPFVDETCDEAHGGTDDAYRCAQHGGLEADDGR